jgi:hypothetical protein
MTVSVCVALVRNGNVSLSRTTYWTAAGIPLNCSVLLLSHQRKLSRRNVVRILQCEKETCETVIAFVVRGRAPLQRREATENVPICVQYQHHCVCMTVAVVVEISCAETVTAATP